MSEQVVEVVVGVIVRGGRLLLTQRRADGSYPWSWESPGGKVEPGETRKQSLARELREELDCAADVGSLLWMIDFAAQDARDPRRVAFFEARLLGEPRPLQSVGLGWFTAIEIRGLVMAPANDILRAELGMRASRLVGA